MKIYLILAFVCFVMCVPLAPIAAARALEFETTEVTAADVALSPDGQWLVFSMLGHLFRLPVEGGTAEQLTFGPYYDSDPVVAPDGTRLAFTSDRDGSESNVFVLDLGTSKITQVTRESRAIRPTWTPDGQAIVYLLLVPEAAHYRGSIWGPIPSLVRRIFLAEGEPETLSASPREIRSLFYMPDGRLAWTVLEREAKSAHVTTRIEVIDTQGDLSTLRLLEGIGDRVIVSPTGAGLYCRRILPFSRNVAQEHLLFLPLPEGREQEIAPVSGTGRGWGNGRWYWGPRIAVAANDETLFVGDAGRLWRIEPSSGARQPIPFRARIKLEIQDQVPPTEWVADPPGSSVAPRIVTPLLSPDGRRLILTAAGYLWQQQPDDGPAQRLFDGNDWEGDAALSPNGRLLAFVHWNSRRSEIRVFDFETKETRSLARAEDPENLSWSPDGQRIAFTDGEEDLKVLDIASGQTRTVASGTLHPRLSWSADGQQLVFCDHDEAEAHRVVAVNLRDGIRKVLTDELPFDAGNVQMSADSESLYFSAHCGAEIWAAPLGEEPVQQDKFYRLSREGGDTFTLTSDSSALIYSTGNRVWRQPLEGGGREQIPVRLEFQRPTPPPLLLRHVRVLEFPSRTDPDASGGFGLETSLLIEQGRIRWIGSESGRRLPPRTVTLDAGGRFAIPGLFDMHQHHGDAAAYLAYGVTSVRNVGGGLSWLNVLADRSETTSNPMPRYFYSADIFDGPGVTGRVVLENEDDARRCVRLWKERGAHLIKAYASLPWPLHRAVAEEARRQGLPLIAHGERLEQVTKGVTLGYWTFEHIGSRERFYDDVLQMLALAGAAFCPTLGMVGHTPWLLRDEPERLDDPKLRAFYSDQSILETRTGVFKNVGDRMLRGFVFEQYAGIYAAHRRGVKLLPGSHAASWALPGASQHWEIEFFVTAGIEPLEALRLATQESAVAVGAEENLGTLEPGKLADLVLLVKNPLEDIRNTQTIWRVIKDGWVFDPEELVRAVSTP